MKVKYTKELNKVCLHIEMETLYVEDYQIHMIKRNKLFGILPLQYLNADGKSRFTYDVSGMKSMRKRYEAEIMTEQEILTFIQALLKTVNEIRNHMLHPDGLLLHPNYIFYQNKQWYFVYQPVKKLSMEKTFHELSEYFVETLDYAEAEGIQLAYQLHKETMQENYNLEQVIEKYKEQKRAREQVKTEIPKEEPEDDIEENIFTMEEEYPVVSNHATLNHNMTNHSMKNHNMINHNMKNHNMIGEKKAAFLPLRSLQERFHRGKWGNWDGFIMEEEQL